MLYILHCETFRIILQIERGCEGVLDNHASPGATERHTLGYVSVYLKS